jgi:hypothetical protein
LAGAEEKKIYVRLFYEFFAVDKEDDILSYIYTVLRGG